MRLADLLFFAAGGLRGHRLRSFLSLLGVGIGVAVPHAMIPEVHDFVIAIGRSHKGIDFDALDEQPVFIIVMIAASDQHPRGEYLKVLARLMQKLRNKEFRRQVMFARTPRDIRDAFLAQETEQK